MPGPNIDKLLILQERDLAIARIERELKDIPARKAEIESRLKEHREALESATNALKLEQARMKELELSVASERERLNKLKQQQMQLKTNAEFKAMENEIKTAETKIRTLEDSELEIMADMETAEAALKVREKELQDEEELVSVDLSAMDQRTGNMEGELQEVQARRDEVAEEVDKPWLTLYQRLAANKGGAVLVSIDHGVCSGCHMRLPPQLVHNVAREDQVVTCNYCGRLLYRD